MPSADPIIISNCPVMSYSITNWFRIILTQYH